MDNIFTNKYFSAIELGHGFVQGHQVELLDVSRSHQAHVLVERISQGSQCPGPGIGGQVSYVEYLFS